MKKSPLMAIISTVILGPPSSTRRHPQISKPPPCSRSHRRPMGTLSLTKTTCTLSPRLGRGNVSVWRYRH